jgi:hypothetical protein
MVRSVPTSPGYRKMWSDHASGTGRWLLADVLYPRWANFFRPPASNDTNTGPIGGVVARWMGAHQFAALGAWPTACAHGLGARQLFLAETVIQYVLRRLNEIGVDDIFGVAGDYTFPLNDAIVEHPTINWIGCCNELNAAYVAGSTAFCDQIRGHHTQRQVQPPRAAAPRFVHVRSQ